MRRKINKLIIGSIILLLGAAIYGSFNYSQRSNKIDMKGTIQPPLYIPMKKRIFTPTLYPTLILPTSVVLPTISISDVSR